ncbi:MAG: hypothetical protein QOI63_1996 [Thermoplasmata archaeon]|jgi:hypothetical protein|nr:hypothetical protein [Thermoplasmata archaeon]
MRATLLAAPALLLSLLLPLAATPSGAQASGDYAIVFSCPPAVTSDAAASTAPTACPSYVLDTEDVMAQPMLVVDPRDPGLVAFNALHGGTGVRAPTQDPLPTPHSRDNLVHQPHTTFVSRDAGSHWEDHRYPSPLATQHDPQPSPLPLQAPAQDGHEVFGEDNAMVADRHGALTIASLYSARDEKGGPVHFRIVAWSEGRIGSALDYDKGYSVLQPTDPDAAVDSLAAVDLPSAGQTILSWRETGADGKAWLQMAHRAQGDDGAQWELLPRGQRIGPCSHVSNAIAVDGRVYAACVAADGYPGVGNKGQVQVHAVTPGNWTSERVSALAMQGVGNVVMASTEGLRTGGMVIAGSGLREGRPVAQVAYGVRGAVWGRAHDYAPQLTDQAAHPGARLLEARVNALAVLSTSGTVHLVYMERYDVQGTGGQAEFAKSYGAAQLDGRFLGRFPIGFGDPQSRATQSPQISGLGSDVFDDQHDSIVVTRDRSGKERAFVAFGDYGYVRFGEVREQQPPPPLVPPIGAPAAIPTLAASTSPVLVGALAGTLSTAAVLRAALAKSKKAVEAPTL